jgi:hypothetical protein
MKWGFAVASLPFLPWLRWWLPFNSEDDLEFLFGEGASDDANEVTLVQIRFGFEGEVTGRAS